MSKLSVTLSKTKPKHFIQLNVDQPFLKVFQIRIPSADRHSYNVINQILGEINIHSKFNYGERSYNSNVFIGNGNTNNLVPNTGVIEINKVLTDYDTDEAGDSIELFYESLSKYDLEIEITYECKERNISLVNPFENFKRHISQKDNVKILFSAPFGQGKTTFLNYFFEQHIDEYEVFKVFPVNYSISHNEDVFKYIKAEILFQILCKDVEFDKESFSYFLTAPQFFKNDPVRVLSPLISLIPKVGKSAYDHFDKLYILAKEYFDYHDKSKIDDENKALKFINELYEKEGSVFEDNFYTQLIRQLLERLKAKTKKKNVLIIEDLDRMDPDHIFRILNVFAAHFDAPEYDYGYSNKFGFDKIIIVADVNNIRETFSYRYGPNVDFTGYINKYYSRAPFLYNNKLAIAEIIRNVRKGAIRGEHYPCLELLMLVLNDMLSIDIISLRDLLNIQKQDILRIMLGLDQQSSKRGKEFYHQFIFFNMFYLLSKNFGIDTLISKIENCKYRLFEQSNISYNYLSKIGLTSLTINKNDETGSRDYQHNNFKIRFEFFVNYHHGSNYTYYDIKNIAYLDATNRPSTIVNFDSTDFYEILLLNIKKYKKMGGFD